MSSKGWFNLEAGTNNALPDTQYFEGDSAFKFLGLTRTQRIYGFIGCGVAGFALSLLGTIVFLFGWTTTFATLYAIGTLISLLGAGFLLGFFKQLKLMFKPVRVVATLILLASIIMIFVAAFPLDEPFLCIIFVITQYLAYTWYTLSYIPYARAGVKKMFGMG